MPWTFEGQLPRCTLFTQWLANCPEDVEHSFSGTPGLEPVTGEPGIYRARTVSALLEGTFEVAYMGWPTYQVTGFSDANAHTTTKQAGPAGHSVTKAINGNAVWWCANPRGDQKLDYDYIAADSGPQQFVPTADETFIVPVIGSCTVGGQKLDRYGIGRRQPASAIDLNFDEDGTVVMFIWERP